jgi:hypothetical protein
MFCIDQSYAFFIVAFGRMFLFFSFQMTRPANAVPGRSLGTMREDQYLLGMVGIVGWQGILIEHCHW